MSTSISYTNTSGEQIPLEQVGNFQSYNETIIENNQKRVNIYSDGKIINTVFYVSSESDIAPILASNPNSSYEIAPIQINSYLVRQTKNYKKGNLDSNFKNVINMADDLICIQKYDIESGLPNYSFTEKMYYENDKLIYLFEYNNDGTCILIEQAQVDDTESTFMATEIGVNPDIDFTWTGFEYYQNAEPLVPTD